VDHKSDGHNDIIVHVATMKHNSNGPMTSPCPLLLCFSYLNELGKNIDVFKWKNITNVVIFLFQVNDIKFYIFQMVKSLKKDLKIYIIPYVNINVFK
jgi:hypothetical protein